MRDERGLLEVVLGDGRFLIALTGISLLLSGGFAVLQSVSGQLLPQDSHAIGMDSFALMQAGNRRLLGFMFHDRVAYGGSLLAIGAGYLWLAAFPMQVRSAWAWWALVFSGAIGFLAFLTYLGRGYLDTWHGVATLFLLPVFAAGLWRSRPANLSLPLCLDGPSRRRVAHLPVGKISTGSLCDRHHPCWIHHRDLRDDQGLRAIGSTIHRAGRSHPRSYLTVADPRHFS